MREVEREVVAGKFFLVLQMPIGHPTGGQITERIAQELSQPPKKRVAPHDVCQFMSEHRFQFRLVQVIHHPWGKHDRGTSYPIGESKGSSPRIHLDTRGSDPKGLRQTRDSGVQL